jgi:hypothetical protein
MQCIVTYAQVCIRIFLLSVLRYRCLILNIYHPDTLYLHGQGCEDPRETAGRNVWETLLWTFIREEVVQRDTEYPAWCFSWFCSVPEGNVVIISQVRQRSSPFTFLPVLQVSSYHRRCVIRHNDGIVDESLLQSLQPSILTHTPTTCEMLISVYREDVLEKFNILAQVPLVDWSRADTHNNKAVDPDASLLFADGNITSAYCYASLVSNY